MRSFLKLTQAPAVEPVTVAEVKAASRISHAAEDTLIEGWIRAAREIAEGFQRRSYITQRWQLSFDCIPETPILLPRSPVSSVQKIYLNTVDLGSVCIYSSVAGEPPDVYVDFLIDIDSSPARIALYSGATWPSYMLDPINSVQIMYTAGYGVTGADTPAAVKDAIMLYCSWRNENRTAEVDAPPHFYNLLRPDRLFL